LDRAAAATGAVPILTDAEGRLLAAPAQAGALAGMAERLRGIEPGTVALAAGERVVAIGTVPLTDASGQVIGARRWLADVTDRRWGQDGGALLAGAALLAAALLLAAILALWLRQAFRPLEMMLAAQAALAEGDLTVELPGQDRDEEIGRAARALAVFRDGAVALRRRLRADARHRDLRLRFIEAQLGALAETLDAGERRAMQRDLDRVLAAARGGGDGAAGMDALALAFRALAERVRSQHQSLRALIAEQDDALAAKSRMEQLERELSAVAAMQSRLLPPAMPAESGVAVAGRLLQGAQFGGDFQDAFWLDAPGGRLAVFVGSVRGSGLGAAFLAISARALIRAIAPQSGSPGEALSRVSDLLLRDNDQRMEVTGFLGVLDLRAQVLVAARAAAPPPVLLLRPGEARVLEVPGAPPLGLQPRLKVPEVTLDLPARAALVAVSRGVPEAVLRGAPLGQDGLRGLLADAPDLAPDALVARLLDRLAAPDAARAGDASVLVARPDAAKALGGP
ncbi:PP2C family protein-serine/threonine phosphatase, partial [Paracraurococcus ruber]